MYVELMAVPRDRVSFSSALWSLYLDSSDIRGGVVVTLLEIPFRISRVLRLKCVGLLLRLNPLDLTSEMQFLGAVLN